MSHWDFSFFSLALNTQSIKADTIAVFQNDLQPLTPKAGWSYWWNSSGPIGTTSHYTALVPANPPFIINEYSGYLYYDTTGTSDFPSPVPASHLFFGYNATINQAVGHTGQGWGQAGFERFAIASYTINTPGSYEVRDALLANLGSSTDGITVLVFANDVLIKSAVTSHGLGNSVSFDAYLGSLESGSRIDVAIGPGEVDYSDLFTLNYTISSVPEINPSALGQVTTLLIGALGLLERRRRVTGTTD